jgi:hypothetical protein
MEHWDPIGAKAYLATVETEQMGLPTMVAKCRDMHRTRAHPVIEALRRLQPSAPVCAGDQRRAR